MKRIIIFCFLLLSSVIIHAQITGTITDTRDGHIYKTVRIGDQWWMAQNLAYLPSVGPSSTVSYTESYCYVYGYEGTNVTEAKGTSNYQTYGVLYNWTAAMNLCPGGWHLPSTEEWSTFSSFLINNGYGYNGVDNWIAKPIASTTSWEYSSIQFEPGNDPSTNNSTGFSVLPGGFRYYENYFSGIKEHGFFWSSSENETIRAFSRRVSYNSVLFNTHTHVKEYGFSVRCIKDNITHDSISIKFTTYKENRKAPLSGANVTIAYHINNLEENNLNFRTGVTNGEGRIVFKIPYDSDFTCFANNTESDPIIITDINLQSNKNYELVFQEETQNPFLVTLGIITPLLTNKNPSVSSIVGSFDIPPSQNSSIKDYKDFVFDYSSSFNYDFLLISPEIGDQTQKVTPATLARPSKKEDLGAQLCNAITSSLSLLSAYLGIPGPLYDFPFCPYSSEPEIMEIDGIEYTVENVGPPIFFGLIQFKQKTGWAIKEASAIDQSFIDNSGKITGSYYENGIFVTDKYEIPGVYYSGHLSHPNMIFIEENIQGQLILQPTELGNYTTTYSLITKDTIGQIIKHNKAVNLNLINLPFPPFNKNDIPIAKAKILKDTINTTENQYFYGNESYDPNGLVIDFKWMENGLILSKNQDFNKSFSQGDHFIDLIVTNSDSIFSIDRSYFYVNLVTGNHDNIDYLKGNNTTNGILIYPNPFTNSLMIKFSNQSDKPYSLYIRDLSGRLIKKIANIIGSEYSINCEDIKPGLYIIELIGSSRQSFKTIKL